MPKNYYAYNRTFKCYKNIGKSYEPEPMTKKEAEAFVANGNRQKGGKWVVHSKKQKEKKVGKRTGGTDEQFAKMLYAAYEASDAEVFCSNADEATGFIRRVIRDMDEKDRSINKEHHVTAEWLETRVIKNAKKEGLLGTVLPTMMVLLHICKYRTKEKDLNKYVTMLLNKEPKTCTDFDD